MRRFFCLILLVSVLLAGAHAQQEPQYAALTFDDGPSGRFTRRLLEGLEQRDAKATFFLCGYRLETYKDLAQRISAEGHEIGLHGYSHDCMAHMSPEKLRQELRRTRELLPGIEVTLLRPPGGAGSEDVRAAAREMGLSVAGWSVDPEDWAIHSAREVQRRVLSQVKDGDIILMHDMTDSSVDAALAIADELQRRGFRLVTVSELAKLRGISLEPGECCERFPPD